MLLVTLLRLGKNPIKLKLVWGTTIVVTMVTTLVTTTGPTKVMTTVRRVVVAVVVTMASTLMHNPLQQFRCASNSQVGMGKTIVKSIRYLKSCLFFLQFWGVLSPAPWGEHVFEKRTQTKI